MKNCDRASIEAAIFELEEAQDEASHFNLKNYRYSPRRKNLAALKDAIKAALAELLRLARRDDKRRARRGEPTWDEANAGRHEPEEIIGRDYGR